MSEIKWIKITTDIFDDEKNGRGNFQAGCYSCYLV